ncbi:Hsp20/alpha crystallin family protein [Chrysosporum ovalisporum APH033B]|uniref:Hsp20/alpha crystallin family protein n=1 Tax=Umezakia ovalisporum TaxID=75695 RepID=UPI0024752EBC|nr:Hsp20/alpha crystallin family protein [Umezakia ovalisporum]MDH6067024.1 Hsp20/alpha crystallin family protein [Umezakia ovalisporum APH033B]MDH6076494.1 Hsp20/alpha crystallin family protein [Umezakia ovalisporum FSS-45]
MTLLRWNPWMEIGTLQRQINSLLEDTTVVSTLFDKDFIKFPPTELEETEDALHLKLELPGMSAKDLDIQVTEKAVYISGERKSETKNEDKGTTKSEFYYGKFQRVIPLCVRIQNNNVTADYKDGILNLTLPKAEEAKNTVVKVNLA